MHTRLVRALKAHAGAVHFRQAVRIVSLHVKEVFDTAAEFFGIGLCTHQCDAQGELARVFAHAAQVFTKNEGIRGQNMGHRSAKILGKLDLTA